MDVEFSDSRDVRDLRDRNRSRGFGSCRDFHFPYNRERVVIFGDDWDTPDGTGVRDYIHVVDLAKAHVKSVEKLANSKGIHIYNIGTGRGYSVLEMVNAFSKACGHDVPYVVGPRREGDIGEVTGNPEKAKDELGWQAELGLAEMVESAWKWQSRNPKGYLK